MSLRTRLTLALVFVVLIPLVAGAITVGEVVPKALHSQAQSRLSAARTAVTDALAARCDRATLSAQLLGYRVSATSPQAAVQAAVEVDDADYAVIVDDDGRVVAHAGELPGAPAPMPTPSELGSCAAGAVPFAVAAPVLFDVANQPNLRGGAVAWSVSDTYARSLRASLDGAPDVTLVLGDKAVASTLPPAQAGAVAKAARDHLRGDTFTVGSRLAVASSPADHPFVVVVGTAKPDTAGLVYALIGLVAFAALAAAAIGVLIARMATQPLAELSTAADQVAGGDLTTRLAVQSRDEVGRLGTAFNRMTEQLRAHVGALERSRDELRRNVERMGTALSHTHDLGGILTVVLDTALASVGARAGAVLLVEGDGDLIEQVSRGLEDLAGEPLRIPRGAGVNGEVVAGGEAVRGLTNLAGGDLALGPGEPAVGALIAVPLKHGGRVIGVLDVFDPQGAVDGESVASGFSAQDLQTLQTLAGQASVAVDNVLLHQEAERLSLTDPLTGLWNYRYFTHSIAREIERATRFGRVLSLLMLDLDRFKTVNDVHGHQAGDAVLVELAARMREQVREVDTVARYGGEEFVVVLPETDADGAARAAERICEVVRATPFHVDGRSLHITVSIGAAVFPEHGATMAALVHAADTALYDAKNGGRDGWRMPAAGGPAADSSGSGTTSLGTPDGDGGAYEWQAQPPEPRHGR